ncbi:hypothetical protein BN874_120036 [Candidatus Contendobacter odensis Run_B_J11]|uniref:Uncharacterized protein n=1 Tax=Candidatus Contendobacter odensis Run_B_J11 TaxID=1400861 RepID=A0A7U7G893_9GAMM|nr:hypothetical protein BN874_120036 [Candidatus Contendobacter odensis Run_B_J11]
MAVGINQHGASSRKLHGIRGLIGAVVAGYQRFNFFLEVGAFDAAKLNADAHRPAAGRSPAIDPDHLAGNREPLRIFQQRQQQKHLITQLERFLSWNENSTPLDEGHVIGVQHGLVLDGQGNDALPWSCHRVQPVVMSVCGESGFIAHPRRR